MLSQTYIVAAFYLTILPMKSLRIVCIAFIVLLCVSSSTFAGNGALEKKIDTKVHELATRFADAEKTTRVLTKLVTRLEYIKPRVREQNQRIVTYYITSIQKALTPSSPDPLETVSYDIPNVDMQKVKQTRLDWYNTERKKYDLTAYTYDSKLDSTAQEWAETLTARYAGKNPNAQTVHQRTIGDGYYNYNKITQRFADRGVVATNVHSVTHSENVGWGYVSCKSDDCTQATIDAIKSTFDFFMSEKKANGPHYRSIVKKEFTRIGL